MVALLSSGFIPLLLVSTAFCGCDLFVPSEIDVAGKVVEAETGSAIPDVLVELRYEWAPAAKPEYPLLVSGRTDGEGAFSMATESHLSKLWLKVNCPSDPAQRQHDYRCETIAVTNSWRGVIELTRTSN